MFSATMPPEIRRLADTILRQPVSVQVTPPATTVDRIEQSVYFVQQRQKPILLAHLVNELPMARALVFSRTKHGADRVVKQLHARGIKAEAIHGNKSQNARERALANFKSGKIPVLVATDIAARGIDVDGISHVVNYDFPMHPEDYVHRIGRTGRAHAIGDAISFVTSEDQGALRSLERFIGRGIVRKRAEGFDYNAAAPEREEKRRGDRRERPGKFEPRLPGNSNRGGDAGGSHHGGKKTFSSYRPPRRSYRRHR
jgi:ATP-dependent RNA helicase RhlE